VLAIFHLVGEQALWPQSPGLRISDVQLSGYANVLDERINSGLLKSVYAWAADYPAELRFAAAVYGQPSQVSGVERSRDGENSMFVVHVWSSLR